MSWNNLPESVFCLKAVYAIMFSYIVLKGICLYIADICPFKRDLIPTLRRFVYADPFPYVLITKAANHSLAFRL